MKPFGCQRIHTHCVIPPVNKCIVCGAEGPVEVHHFAPQALFTDAERWPVAHLCHTHHVEWHQVMDGRVCRCGSGSSITCHTG